MTRAPLIVLLVEAGCFYTEPLNQRPSIDIEQRASTVVYRGDMVQLTSKASDPEGGVVHFQWRAYGCKDADVGVDGSDAGCDQVPFADDILPSFSFEVPRIRANGHPLESVLVYLEGTDELGATAKPTQQLIIPLGDKPPTLAVSKPYRRSYVVDIPVNVFAAVGDPDDGIVPPPALTWTVFSPMTQPPFALDDLPNVPPDPQHPELAQLGKVFTPHGTGSFDIQVVATDPLGMTAMADIPIDVAADHAPCLSQLAPIVPPVGQTYPLDQATLFQVLVVDDDLDVYPPSGDPVMGTTAFSWSVLPPGATTRQPLTTATGNRVLLDPASYAPGDQLELRVEIQDRQQLPVNCPDNQPTCSVISDPQCLQRQTWRVEVR